MRQLVTEDRSEEQERRDRRDDETLLVRPLRKLLRERVREIQDDKKEDEDPRKVDVDVDPEEAGYADRTGHVPEHTGRPSRDTSLDGRLPRPRCETRSPRVHGSPRAGGRPHEDPSGRARDGEQQEHATLALRRPQGERTPARSLELDDGSAEPRPLRRRDRGRAP